jgi:hypothetical protein
VDRRFDTGDVLRGVRPPALGDVLVKVGRTTGLTRGRVDGIGTHGGTAYSLRLVPTAGSPGPICLDGDSGAVWYDAATALAVGLHCRGPAFRESHASYAVASAMTQVFAQLRLRMPDPAQ